MKSESNNNIFREYYYLTKPGIIRGNAVSLIAGFLLASQGDFDVILFIAALGGLSFVIASGCVFNNYIDRHIDKKMSRTKNRALVQGRVSNKNAIVYGTILGLIGILLLGFETNLLTLGLALFGLFAYVVLYGVYKRRSPLGTAIGSISGAIPPVVGYCAVTDQIDSAAVILFLILVTWQMPHFYAIGMFRHDDYAAANIPILPVEKGMRATKNQIVIYVVAFIIAVNLLTICNYTSLLYSIPATIIGIIWLLLGIRGFSTQDDKKWARKMFLFSLITLSTTCLLISIDSFI